MAKRKKITTDQAHDRAAMELDALVEIMAAYRATATYDALLEAAARLKPRLSPLYRPSALPTGDLKSATFAHLILETIPTTSAMYHALVNRDPVPFAFSDHPDAVAARLLGAYRALAFKPIEPPNVEA